MKPVLDWIKSNLATVIFIVVMVAALVALPIVSGKMNASVKTDVNERVQLLADLRKLEKSKIEITDPVSGETVSETALVNEKLLDRLERVAEARAEDAERVLALAREHNQKERGVLLPRLFPSPPPAERDVLPEEYHRRLVNAYRDLLEEIQAGEPPSEEEMQEVLQRAEAAFRTQTLQKDVDVALDDEEAMLLTEALTKERMSRYAQQADRIKLYASVGVLDVPAWNQAQQPTMTELFLWQWQYWIVEDVCRGLAAANAQSESVQTAPVKRVIGLWVQDDAFAGAPSGGGGGSGGGSPGMGAGTGRRGTGGSGGGGGGAVGAPANPSLEVKPNYSVSLSGRLSNPLYDVRRVDLTLVVDTARLPQVIDALAQQNFITILDLDVEKGNHYAAAREGYFYGSAPVSTVTLLLETVWLRDWTTQFMPDEVKQALGVPVPNTQG